MPNLDESAYREQLRAAETRLQRSLNAPALWGAAGNGDDKKSLEEFLDGVLTGGDNDAVSVRTLTKIVAHDLLPRFVRFARYLAGMEVAVTTHKGTLDVLCKQIAESEARLNRCEERLQRDAEDVAPQALHVVKPHLRAKC